MTAAVSPDMSAIRIGALELGPDGIAEMAGGRRVAFLPRADVRSVAVGHGFTAERPVAALIAGAALAGIGAHISRHELQSGSTALVVTPLVLVFVGGWLLWTVFRRGTYLQIATGAAERKLVVGRRVGPGALRDALRDAERRFGYAVDWSRC
jgi:hypothetical protein